jgi:uncharacterized SAM-binding protein YcdF (DUF218 family)
MTLGLASILAIAGAVAWRRGWKRTASCVFATIGVLVILLGCGPATRMLLESLQGDVAQHPGITWTDQSAIVVLGAGLAEGVRGRDRTIPVWAFGRLVKVEELYRECRSIRDDCLVFISGGAGDSGNKEADAYGAELVRMGVPAAAVVLERESRNTWENAEFTAKLLHARGRTAPVIVTSALHVRRALLYFHAFRVSGVGVASDYLESELSWYPTALDVAMADLALHEYAGILRYRLYDALGINDDAQ